MKKNIKVRGTDTKSKLVILKLNDIEDVLPKGMFLARWLSVWHSVDCYGWREGRGVGGGPCDGLGHHLTTGTLKSDAI